MQTLGGWESIHLVLDANIKSNLLPAAVLTIMTRFGKQIKLLQYLTY